MKTSLFKNMLPIVAVFLAVSGAFASRVVNDNFKKIAPAVGYTLDAQGECNIAVACNDTPSMYICRLGTSGPIAYGKNAQGRCIETLWRPF